MELHLIIFRQPGIKWTLMSSAGLETEKQAQINKVLAYKWQDEKSGVVFEYEIHTITIQGA